jgi:glutamine amidotransferase
MIVIVDYNVGNLGSILNMLKKIGSPAVISSKSDTILQADKLILPGVGAFDNGMSKLHEFGLIPVLQNKIKNNRTPVLGICLGMQLMTNGSEEGKLPGLGWIDARTTRFKHDPSKNIKVPHMGWNTIIQKKESQLFYKMQADPRFYFVHSYHVVCNRESDVLTVTSYGYDFVSSFQQGNIFGVQFHPEKSHNFGMILLKNFAEMNLC